LSFRLSYSRGSRSQIVCADRRFLAVYFLIDSAPLQPGMPLIVMMVVGLMLAFCTAKILALINKNALAILRAIADINRR